MGAIYLSWFSENVEFYIHIIVLTNKLDILLINHNTTLF